MDYRSESTDADIAKAEAILAQIDASIRQTNFEINAEMDRRDQSFEAAQIASEEEERQIRELLAQDETFSILYLPDEERPSGDRKLKKLQSSPMKNKKSQKQSTVSASAAKKMNDDDYDYQNDDDDEDNSNDDVDDESDDEDLPQPTNVAHPFSPEDKVDGKLPDVKLDHFWIVEAVLARKTVKGRLFYRVKWKGVNLVTWELDTKIENRNAVNKFEQQRYAAAHAQCVNPKKTRPAVYISEKRMKRLAKHDAEAARKLQQQIENERLAAEHDRQLSSARVNVDAAAGTDVIWSCEVEPNIWIPYDLDSQRIMELAFRMKQPACTITVNGMAFGINLSVMKQGNSRRIQRVVVQPVEVPRASNNANAVNFDDMTVGQLRDFIARAQNLQDPRAYEALSRLEELDKAVPSGVGKNVVENFPKCTFEQIMDQICNGVEYPCFSMECPICLEDYVGADELISLPECRHQFHASCIVSFLGKYSKHCPVCRAAVV